jgi:hypothetical protein
MYKNDPMYFVVRFNIVEGGTESHSIQMFDTEIQARKRFHSVLAADIDRTDLLYELVTVLDNRNLIIASEVFDYRPDEVFPDD